MYLQQEALLRPDLEGKEAEVCLPCFHIYKFLEQHYYSTGPERQSEMLHDYQSLTTEEKHLSKD